MTGDQILTPAVRAAHARLARALAGLNRIDEVQHAETISRRTATVACGLDEAIRSGAHRGIDVAIAEWILAAPGPVEAVARFAVIMAEATAEAHGTAATTPSVALLLSMECSVLHHQRGGT